MNLFENYVDNGLNFARKKCVQAMQQVHVTEMYVCQGRLTTKLQCPTEVLIVLHNVIQIAYDCRVRYAEYRRILKLVF